MSPLKSPGREARKLGSPGTRTAASITVPLYHWCHMQVALANRMSNAYCRFDRLTKYCLGCQIHVCYVEPELKIRPDLQLQT